MLNFFSPFLNLTILFCNLTYFLPHGCGWKLLTVGKIITTLIQTNLLKSKEIYSKELVCFFNAIPCQRK